MRMRSPTSLPPQTTTTTTLPGAPCDSAGFPQCNGACPPGASCQAFQATGGFLPIAG
jgi:hypothetical protein